MKEASHQKSGPAISETLAQARTGLFRATLLFGSIAVALALIVVPAADRQAKLSAFDRKGIDTLTTGSVANPEKLRYVVRRSVLQDHAAGPCLMFPDGTRRGAC